MKIKENFHLRKVAGTWAVLPTGDATLDFNGILTLNESGYMLWQLLEKECSREDLAKALTEEYDFESAVNESFTLYAKWQSSFNVWLLLAILALVLLVLLLVWLLLRRRNRKQEPSDENA